MSRLTDSLPDLSDIRLPDISSVSMPDTPDFGAIDVKGLVDDAERTARRFARRTSRLVGRTPSRTVTRNRVLVATVAIVAVAGLVVVLRRRSGAAVSEGDDQFTRAA